MSIESAILELAAAIREGAALVTGMKPATHVTHDAKQAGEQQKTIKKDEPAKTEVKKDETTKTETKALTYDADIKPLAQKLANEKGRDALIGVLKEAGLAKASDAKPEQFEGLIAALTAALK